MSKWMDEFKNKANHKLIALEMKARLTRLALNYSSNKGTKNFPISKGTISSVEKMAITIAENYHKSITVSEVAKIVGLHPDYANSLFKKAFGVTISEQINSERIAHAQRKLTISNLNIGEIAFDCGFNSISNFNLAFNKQNNCTPREYRKINHQHLNI